MRGKEKSESGKARLRAKTSAESEDEEIRRGDKRKQKVRKRAKKGERAEARQRTPAEAHPRITDAKPYRKKPASISTPQHSMRKPQRSHRPKQRQRLWQPHTTPNRYRQQPYDNRKRKTGSTGTRGSKAQAAAVHKQHTKSTAQHRAVRKPSIEITAAQHESEMQTTDNSRTTQDEIETGHSKTRRITREDAHTTADAAKHRRG